ncbi:MAG: NAD(P)/FAD-dependent oxidoreductase [Proteobacteria bacterium]|nr:NAD(P)/FAD-dependent oxidoreductase [Pseudomonadota bacterium]
MAGFDAVVVGAGVVGLACAAELAKAGRSVLVLERGDGVAREVTARNSQVIHAGIYYPPGSLKARLCREGRDRLYARCRERRVPHRRIGKWIVATCEAECAVLEELHARAQANGVTDLVWAEPERLQREEPGVRAVAALWSPSTGIVDAHAFAVSFQAEAEAGGAAVALRHRLLAVEPRAFGLHLEVENPTGEREWIEAGGVVNAAGLASDRVAELVGIPVRERGEALHFCKGDYFGLAPGRSLALSHLVYPVPAQAGLGIHATLDLAGRVRFGPDTEYVAEPDYRVSAGKAAAFAASIQRYLPAVKEDWLVPDMAGVRPKLAGPGDGFRDFLVREASELGVPGWVDCIGIESPGLTAAPALARYVCELLGVRPQ